MTTIDYEVRRDICADCPTPCERQRDAAFHGDPCASCPLTPARWGQSDCGVAQYAPALPVAVDWRSPLLRRVHSYRQAGWLVGLWQFLGRRDACRGCELRLTLPTHPGLYGCGGCSSCGGGPERMLVTQSTCKRGLWPTSSNPAGA